MYTISYCYKETKIDERRHKKLESLVMREVGDIIQREVSDPRVGFCTITAVKITPDIKHARITVSFIGSEKAQKLALSGVKSACPYIQHKLAQRLPLRFTPALEFILDEHTEYRIEELLSEIHKEAENKECGVKKEETE